MPAGAINDPFKMKGNLGSTLGPKVKWIECAGETFVYNSDVDVIDMRFFPPAKVGDPFRLMILGQDKSNPIDWYEVTEVYGTGIVATGSASLITPTPKPVAPAKKSWVEEVGGPEAPWKGYKPPPPPKVPIGEVYDGPEDPWGGHGKVSEIWRASEAASLFGGLMKGGKDAKGELAAILALLRGEDASGGAVFDPVGKGKHGKDGSTKDEDKPKPPPPLGGGTTTTDGRPDGKPDKDSGGDGGRSGAISAVHAAESGGSGGGGMRYIEGSKDDSNPGVWIINEDGSKTFVKTGGYVPMGMDEPFDEGTVRERIKEIYRFDKSLGRLLVDEYNAFARYSRTGAVGGVVDPVEDAPFFELDGDGNFDRSDWAKMPTPDGGVVGSEMPKVVWTDEGPLPLDFDPLYDPSFEQPSIYREGGKKKPDWGPRSDDPPVDDSPPEDEGSGVPPPHGGS